MDTSDSDQAVGRLTRSRTRGSDAVADESNNDKPSTRRVRRRTAASASETENPMADEEDDVCAICLESLWRGPRSVSICRPCKHYYHDDCFGGWRATLHRHENADENPQTKCPTCRGKIEGIDPYLAFRNNDVMITSEIGQTDIEILVRRYLYSSNAGTVSQALQRLCDMVDNHVNVKVILHSGGHISTIKAMDRHQMNDCIQGAGLYVLHRMSKLYSDVILALQEAIDRVIRAVQLHLDDINVTGNACTTLSRLISHSNDMSEARRQIVQQGGISTAIDVMQQHKNHLSPLSRACKLLTNLVAMNQEHARVAGEMGAIPYVVKAMRRFPRDPLLQQRGFTVLGYLADYEANRKIIRDSGGVEAIGAALDWYQSYPYENLKYIAKETVTKIVGW